MPKKLYSLSKGAENIIRLLVVDQPWCVFVRFFFLEESAKIKEDAKGASKVILQLVWKN